MPCRRPSNSVSDESIPSGPVPEFLHQGRRVVHQTRVLSDILGLAEAGFHLQSCALVLQDNRISSFPLSNPGFFFRNLSISPIASLEWCIPFTLLFSNTAFVSNHLLSLKVDFTTFYPRDKSLITIYSWSYRSGSRRSRSPLDSSNRSLPRPSQVKKK